MKKPIIGIFTVLCATTWIYPQTIAEQGLRRYIFSPQLLRRHQHELQLTEQINQIQSEFTPLQWRLEDEVRKLTNIIENRASKEEDILQQLGTVLDLEKDIKSKQLLLAVCIRNSLSEENCVILELARYVNKDLCGIPIVIMARFLSKVII